MVGQIGMSCKRSWSGSWCWHRLCCRRTGLEHSSRCQEAINNLCNINTIEVCWNTGRGVVLILQPSWIHHGKPAVLILWEQYYYYYSRSFIERLMIFLRSNPLKLSQFQCMVWFYLGWIPSMFRKTRVRFGPNVLPQTVTSWIYKVGPYQL